MTLYTTIFALLTISNGYFENFALNLIKLRLFLTKLVVLLFFGLLSNATMLNMTVEITRINKDTNMRWIITALAIYMGAPFWFDILGKLVNVRSTGKKS
jgi:hypothetical protein